MRDKEEQVDMTYLSVDLAERRGFIHRDYVAHCLRWSFALRHLTATARLLDAGCGKEAPLAQVLYTNRYTHVSYLGVDYGPIKPTIEYTGTWQPSLWPSIDLPLLDATVVRDTLGGTPTHVTCLEVLEHMLPERAVRALAKLKHLGDADTTYLVSTPVYDPRVGAAANHINEWTYDALWYLFDQLGLEVTGQWGTFASQRDYKPLMTVHQQVVFDQLSQYYDANLMANIMAPMFPAESRNVLWQLKHKQEARSLRGKMWELARGPENLGSCPAPAWADAYQLLGLDAPSWSRRVPAAGA